MPSASRYRYDLGWSRGHVGAAVVLCAVAAGLLASKGEARRSYRGGRPAVDAGRVRQAEEKINPNTAGAASLRRCPMIGPVRAMAIVEYRRRHPPAPFRTPADLVKVKGIGEATIKVIAPLLALPGGDSP